MNDLIDIDWEQLHQISEDDPEFELELLTMLAEDVKIHIVDLHQAIIERNFPMIAHEAHYIKGASANLGVIGLTTLAKQIEQLARDSHGERLRQEVSTDTLPLVEQMTDQIELLETYLATRS